MANKQGWEDFRRITELIENIEGAVKSILGFAGKLEYYKTEILDDVSRKDEIKKIIDIHPDWTLTQITNCYTKIMALKTYVESM